MWSCSTAIPAIAPFAKVEMAAIRLVEALLEAGDLEAMAETLSSAYAAFEEKQPVVARRMAVALNRCHDDAVRGLGVYLVISVWLSFQQELESQLGQVSDIDYDNTEAFLAVDAELRKRTPDAGVDTDDVVAMQQPALAGYIRERIDETLRTYENDIDIDEVDRVYQLTLAEVLVLSYAVQAPPESAGSPKSLS